MPEDHQAATHFAFSNIVVFTLSRVQYKYVSDTYWKRKTEAKNNVAYKACLDHGLPKPKVKIKHTNMAVDKCYKSLLQERMHASSGSGPCNLPAYETAVQPGVCFLCWVTVGLRDGTSKTFTSGRLFGNKKAAEKHVAKIAFNALYNNTEQLTGH